MKIYIDADACPNVIKNIIFRASDRSKTEVLLVANQYMATPASSPNIYNRMEFMEKIAK